MKRTRQMHQIEHELFLLVEKSHRFGVVLHCLWRQCYRYRYTKRQAPSKWLTTIGYNLVFSPFNPSNFWLKNHFIIDEIWNTDNHCGLQVSAKLFSAQSQ